MRLLKDAGNRGERLCWQVEDCAPKLPGRLDQRPGGCLRGSCKGKYGRGTVVASSIEVVEILVCQLGQDKHGCTTSSGGQMMQCEWTCLSFCRTSRVGDQNS